MNAASAAVPPRPLRRRDRETAAGLFHVTLRGGGFATCSRGGPRPPHASCQGVLCSSLQQPVDLSQAIVRRAGQHVADQDRVVGGRRHVSDLGAAASGLRLIAMSVRPYRLRRASSLSELSGEVPGRRISMMLKSRDNSM